MNASLTDIISRVKFHLLPEHKEWLLCVIVSATDNKGLTFSYVIGLHSPFPSPSCSSSTLVVLASDENLEKCITKFVDNYKTFSLQKSETLPQQEVSSSPVEG